MRPNPVLSGTGRLCIGLGFTLLVLFASSLAAQDEGTEAAKGSQSFFQGEEPGKLVPINLKSGTIQKTLPFDVHFYLTGELDNGVKSMEGRSVGFKTVKTCKPELARLKKDCSKLTASIVDCNPAEEAALTKEISGKMSFEILVPPLQPNRYYCFEISWLSEIKDPAQIDRFRKALHLKVAEVLNQEKWVIVEEGFPRGFDNRKILEELHGKLIAAANASLDEGQVLDAEPGSFFHEETSLDEIERAVGELIAQINNRQVGRVSALGRLRGAATKASDGLSDLSKSPEWIVAAQALRDHASQPRVELALKDRQASLELIGPSVDPVALSQGRKKPEDQIWDAGDINLAPTIKRLGDLKAIASDLRTSANLRQAAELDQQGSAFFQKLEDLVDSAFAAFDQDLQNAVRNLTEELAARSLLLDRLEASVNALLLQVAGLRASTVAEYETRATWYMSADLGTALAPDLEEVFTYTGANIYFRPVNKKAHLRWADLWTPGQRWTDFRRRFSVTLGRPQDDIEAKNIEPLIQGKPALVAAGFRVTDYVRLNVGALVFKEKNPNPLVDTERLVWNWLTGLSIDWNIAGTMKGMFQKIVSPGTQE